ncbi:MAG: efflux RND transporter periplasmic adaptor subunit [Bacteroidota bacterium]|nr:efflux RND transporter periplasmic adaptor subunit [Bacteroidota bacterium]
MKKSGINKWIYAIIIALAGIMAGWLIGSSQQKTVPAEEHKHAVAESEDETQIWTCSMHPQIRQPEAGDCPICGMDLIPLDDDTDESSPMEIRMSPTAMQLADIVTTEVGKTKPEKLIRLDGKVQADERLVYSQSSHIPGRVEKLMLNFTGEYVKKGSPIAYVYSPELVTAQEELFEARKVKDVQPALFNAAKQKLKNWKMSDDQIEKILSSGKIREEFPVLADVSGYVLKKMVNNGDYIRLGQSIYQIADLSKVWVMFDVYESDLPWVNEGDEVTFTVASLPGEEFSGQISFLDPVIDPKTRVAKARLEVSNKDLKLKPEMFVSGTLTAELDNASEAIVIPKSAVMWTGKRSIVYVKSSSGRGVSFLLRNVVLGPALGNSFIIESGLEAGEEIAVHGTFSIDAAAQLAGKPSMMNEEGGQAMTGHQHGGNTMSQEAVKSLDKEAKISEAFKEQLTTVYNAYIPMKNAFVKSDAEKVKSGAEKVLENLEDVDMGLLEGEAHMVWMDQLKALKKNLRVMISDADIEIQRGAFAKFNEAFYQAVQDFGLSSLTTYYQYCPMAIGNQGAFWFSEKENIENPYFGDMMLSCGETRETFDF